MDDRRQSIGLPAVAPMRGVLYDIPTQAMQIRLIVPAFIVGFVTVTAQGN
jgi:hypothetical protein